MAARKKKAAKKEADQQRALAKQLRALLDAARAEVETNTRAIKESAERDCAQASASLHAKMERIKSFIAEFEAGLKSEWEEYLALHAEAEAVAQHAQHEVAEAKAAGKRKLDEVTGEMERRMSTEEKRRKNKAKRAKRVPDLASILVPLLAG